MKSKARRVVVVSALVGLTLLTLLSLIPARNAESVEAAANLLERTFPLNPASVQAEAVQMIRTAPILSAAATTGPMYQGSYSYWQPTGKGDCMGGFWHASGIGFYSNSLPCPNGPDDHEGISNMLRRLFERLRGEGISEASSADTAVWFRGSEDYIQVLNQFHP